MNADRLAELMRDLVERHVELRMAQRRYEAVVACIQAEITSPEGEIWHDEGKDG